MKAHRSRWDRGTRRLKTLIHSANKRYTRRCDMKINSAFRWRPGNDWGGTTGAWKPARYALRVNERWMIYGAYGYTGELIAREAIARGMTPVLAGRRSEPVSSLAQELGLEHRAFGLENPDLLTSGLENMTLVLHSAGPYSATSGPMVEGCLKTGAHYLDITGEIRVFESLHARDEEARNAGVIILPGVGFDVVPTDCLAARLASCVDRPTTLELAFRTTGSITQGTAKGVVESMGYPNLVRRGGQIVEVPMGSLLRDVPFSDKTRFGLSIPWGDVSTAYYSTGIPDITVYRTMHPTRARKAPPDTADTVGDSDRSGAAVSEAAGRAHRHRADSATACGGDGTGLG